MFMARKKMTTYMEEDLLRTAKILAARRNCKVYEVLEEALRRYLEEADAAEEPRRAREVSLAEALSGQQACRLPGMPREKAVRLSEGETLSEAVLAERESRDY